MSVIENTFEEIGALITISIFRFRKNSTSQIQEGPGSISVGKNLTSTQSRSEDRGTKEVTIIPLSASD